MHVYFWAPEQWDNTWGAKNVKTRLFLNRYLTYIYVRQFHNSGQNTKVKIETDSQRILVTLNEVEVFPKFHTNRTSGTGGNGLVLSRRTIRCSLHTPRGAVGAANTSRQAAAGRRSGNNTCECSVESSFNACLKVIFLQDRRTPVAEFLGGSSV